MKLLVSANCTDEAHENPPTAAVIKLDVARAMTLLSWRKSLIAQRITTPELEAMEFTDTSATFVYRTKWYRQPELRADTDEEIAGMDDSFRHKYGVVILTEHGLRWRACMPYVDTIWAMTREVPWQLIEKVLE